jgi:hypothetical protein
MDEALMCGAPVAAEGDVYCAACRRILFRAERRAA